jgi:hypothetical protein
MSHLPLYKLPPCDPENLLSRESRQRIQAAYMAAERIKIQTLSRLQTRYRSEPSRGDTVGKGTRVAVARALETTPEELFRE